MALFCSKCGTQLEEGSRFCSKCGAVTVPGEEQGATSNPNVGSLADSLKDMTLDESILLADKLHKQYTEMEKLGTEIAGNEEYLKHPVDTNVAHYSWFRFFWKWIIICVVTFVVLVNFAPVFANYGSNAKYIFFYSMAVIIPIILLVIGIVSATKKVNAANSYIDASTAEARKKKEETAVKNEQLKSRRELLRKKLLDYDSIVPAKLRNSTSMSKIRNLLKSGKAKNFEDAVNFLR